MRKNVVLVLILAFAMVLCLASCGGGKKEEMVTISFDTDGGSAVEPQTIKKGSAVVKPDTPKKIGYIFDKWVLGEKEYEFGSAVNEDITLKALWIDPSAQNDNKANDGQNEGSGGNSNNEQSSAPTGKPGIKLSKDRLVLDYHNNEASNTLYPLTVTFENGADPSSKITWTSSNPETADVGENGMIMAYELGYTMITATTQEGYTAYCNVFVQGTALKVFITGGGGELHSGSTLELGKTYELSVIKYHYYDNYSDTIYMTDQVELVAPTGIGFDPQTQYYGILTLDSSYLVKGENYHIQFVDSLNNVKSDRINLIIK